MTNIWRKISGMALVAAVASFIPATPAIANDQVESHVRFDNPRILEVFRNAHDRSASFGELVATLDMLDAVVYVEEGRCRHRGLRACLVFMPTPGGRHLLIRIDPRQQMRSVVAQLAHELYHAVEVARRPEVHDPASLRALYEEIGERACGDPDECWETRAAVAFEALVNRETHGAPMTTRR